MQNILSMCLWPWRKIECSIGGFRSQNSHNTRITCKERSNSVELEWFPPFHGTLPGGLHENCISLDTPSESQKHINTDPPKGDQNTTTDARKWSVLYWRDSVDLYIAASSTKTATATTNTTTTTIMTSIYDSPCFQTWVCVCVTRRLWRHYIRIWILFLNYYFSPGEDYIHRSSPGGLRQYWYSGVPPGNSAGTMRLGKTYCKILITLCKRPKSEGRRSKFAVRCGKTG